jgi:NAD(P)-dependent dehydrogenase (short-subunit alcohol dehydrogenase family)
MSDLTGKVVLVTGAARRIGRDIALRLAREGARVAIHYGTSEAAARATAAECGGAPVFQADLEKVPEIQRMVDEVGTHFGRLDALVNNAARFTKIPVLEISEADWDFIHSVNLKASFFCAQRAALWMKKNPGGEGRIVNISSLGGFLAWSDHVHYCASKAGVVHMTRALAKALAPNITVNSVAPGVIPYDEKDQPHIQALVRETPAGRAGTGADIADGVVFFLTASSFITGQILQVDGGFALG